MTNHVLVIGDVMLDVWMCGEMTRVSPEAPSPIVKLGATTCTGGGAANVAVNLAALGQRPMLLGVVGNDQSGEQLRDILATAGVAVNLCVAEDAVTIQKMRVLSSGQQVMRMDSEQPGLKYPEAIASQVRHGFLTALGVSIGAIVIADYAKGVIAEPLAREIVATGLARGIPVFVDTKPDRHEWYRGATLLKPNFNEAVRMCDALPALIHPAQVLGDEEDQAAVMCRHLVSTYGFSTVVVTRGSQGATCYDGTESPFTSSVASHEVYDVTGAGDTFMAALVDAFMRGYAFAPAVLRAHTAAGVAVGHRRTYAVSQHELEDAVRARNGIQGKIMPLGQLCPWIKRRRLNDQTIVMTNGCYRLLHHGHIASFRWAAHQGDLLVVAINSDAAIEQLKGCKPVIPEDYRAEMIAQYPCVDAVVIFNDVDVTATVKAVQPDILVKGAQYADAIIPGGDYVARRGGEVRFAPMVAGISSTVLEENLATNCDNNVDTTNANV